MSSSAAIIEHFRAKLNLDETKTDQDLDGLVYFNTYTFDEQARSRCQTNPSVLLELVKLFNFRVNRILLGNNLSRHLLKQPLTYAFIDVDGTRHSKRLNPADLQFAHVHSLTCIEPEYAKRFHEIITQMKKVPIAGIMDIEVRQYDHNIKPLDYLTTYCMKGYKAMPAAYKHREDLWTVIPFGLGSAKGEKPTQAKLKLIKRSDRLHRKIKAREQRLLQFKESLQFPA